MSEGKPSWDEAVGMLERRIAEQASAIDAYRNEVTRLMAERDREAAGAAAAHERTAELVSEVNELRALLGEILADCPGCGFWHGPPTGRVQAAEWRKRAG